ncbi:MAG: hypothetical protein U9Q21_02545 [Candidatus Auribacterota bacterium]|nr:hypothetical protein [Candidatus Auribacterota bacterium]
MAKTWTQHDYNCHEKPSFDDLRSRPNGNALYGMFWILEELLGLQNLTRAKASNILILNERTLCQKLKINARSLPSVMGHFRDCLGLVWETDPKHTGNLTKTYLPKSLVFNATKRRVELDKDKDKEVDGQPKNAAYECELFLVRKEEFEVFEKAYPKINIMAELPKMRSWLISNPARHKSNYKRFINNWLGRCRPDLDYVNRKAIERRKAAEKKQEAEKKPERYATSDEISEAIKPFIKKTSMGRVLNENKL